MPGFSSLAGKLSAYLSPDDLRVAETAFAFSERAHAGQTRASGKPFIVHPLAVADILADWRFDARTIAAALLHDVVEDTEATADDIDREFGRDVARIVDGVSKIDRLENIDRESREAENFRKLLLAAAEDWRVVFIKLADRLHNMRTLSALSGPERRRRVAGETLDIYAPIADRLGFASVSEELQNLSFRHLHPHRHRVLSKALANSLAGGRNAAERAGEKVGEALERGGVKADIETRRKNLYSIYRKMLRHRLSFAEVEDIVGFRVIVADRPSCYLALGLLHEAFRPAPNTFTDYIAMPKANGYQSLHTTLITRSGLKLEAQIRTRDMHEIAETGLAAHWIYKQSAGGLDPTQQEALSRLASLLRLHAENAAPSEFLEHVKVDLFPSDLYVLTPQGAVIILPRESSALDFAYAIHTDVGDHAERAVINGRHLPISAKLQNGDQIRIVTNPDASPLPHWIGYVRTARARSRIRHVLNLTQRDRAEFLGKKLLANALAKLDAALSPDGVSDDDWRLFLSGQAMTGREDLYCAIGLGKIMPDIAARGLARRAGGRKSRHAKLNPILVGSGDSAVRLSECCRPLPPEPIVGLLSKNHGLAVHSADCPVIHGLNKRSEKWTDVAWSDSAGLHPHPGALTLECRNQTGLMSSLTRTMGERDINIVSCNFSGGATERETLTVDFVLEVRDLGQMEGLLSTLNRMPVVIQARRARDGGGR